MSLALLLLLAAPQSFRALALWRLRDKETPETRLRLAVLPFLLGLSEDLLVAGAFAALAALLRTALSPLAAGVVVGAGVLAYHVYVFADDALFRSTDVRMTVSFLAFAGDLAAFRSSLEHAGLRALLGAACAGAAIYALSVAPGWPGVGFLALFAVSLALAAVLRRQLDPSLHYAFGNVLVEDLWRRAVAASALRAGPSELAIVRGLGPQHERFTSAHADYPLFKRTLGFSGDRQFALRIEPGERPHVVIVFLESFCAGDTGATGGTAGITPCFDRAARDGVLFRQFYAGGVQTARAVIATLFGLWPRLSYRSEMQATPTLPLPGLADVMSAAGYRCAYWTGGDLGFENQRQFFASHGFTELVGDADLVRAFPAAAGSSWGVHDEFLFRYAADALGAAKTPTFAVLATMSSHHPFEVPADFVATPRTPPAESPGQDRFRRALRYTDHCLGEFLAALQSNGSAKDTLVVMLGDHGPPIGEFDASVGRYKHLQEERVHVPMLLWAPGRTTPAVIDTLASQCDVMPTVMDILGLGGDNVAVGDSLLRATAERTVVFNNAITVHGWGLRRGSLKYLWSPQGDEALYDLATDPHEQHDLHERHPDALQLRQTLQSAHAVLEAAHMKRRLVPA